MSLEKLDLSVALKLAFVEDSLAKVDEYRTQLHQNAQKVKEEIHDVVDRQVGSLRMRERQLVRQVEVVTAHETCRLSTQQARLMHSKGALSATSSLLQRCVSTDSNTLSKIKVDEMFYSQEVQPAKHVSVQLDESAVSSAISQFGSVQLPDTITHHPSPVIPVKVEEYDDEEHDVLHKSVAGAASEPSNGSGSSSAPMHITVQFPRLNNQHNNWLFRQHSNGNTSGADALNPSKPHATPQNKSNDVAAWLGDLQLSSTVTGDDESSLFHCSEGFDMVATPATSESSSIEIVPLPQDCSSLPGSGVCEIENLHHFINDKSCWLSTKTLPEDTNKVTEKLDITSICQANETCHSFEECLCQNECREKALEKLQQSADFRAKTSRKRTFSEAEGIHSVLAHMAKILTSENSQWLLRNKQENEDSPRPAKCVMYRPPGDQWLCNGNNASIRTLPHAQLPSHSNTWLLKNLKNQKNAQEKDENEMEKEACTREDNRITSEALSEALKRVSVDPTKRNEMSNINESYKKLYTCLPSLTIKDQPWLLPRVVNSNKELYEDNKWQDKKDKAASKHLWLSSSHELSSARSKESSSFNFPSKLQKSSSVHSGEKSWLLH